MNAAEIRTFIRAGRAVFTLQSARTGVHFTYRITQSADKWDKTKPALLFASVLIAPEVWGYLGFIRGGRLVATRRSKVWPDAPSFVGLQWLLRNLECGEVPASAIFRHEGRCGRCARALTTPASVDTGLGPDCAEALGVPHEARPQAMSGTFGEYDERGTYIADRPHGGPSLAQALAELRASYSGDTDGKGNFADDDAYPEP